MPQAERPFDGSASPPGEWNPGALYQHFSSLLDALEVQLLAIITEQEKQRVSSVHDLQEQINRRITVTENERDKLEQHLKALIDAGDARLQAHADAQRDALAEARRNIEERLKYLNNLRDEVLQDRALFVRHDALAAKLDALKALIEKTEETWNRRFDTQAERITAVENQMIERRGGEQVERRRQQTNQPWQIWAAGAFVLIALFALGLLVGSPSV